MLGLLISAGIGLAVGSFLQAYVYRFLKGESVWRGRSHCPHCRHVLTARDLIPLVSFAFLGGRCRYCRKPLSWQYPLAELGTALLFAGAYAVIRPDTPSEFVTLAYWWYLAVVWVVIILIDIRAMVIPDRVIAPAALVTLGYLGYLMAAGSLTSGEAGLHLFTSLGAGAVFLGIVLVSGGRWMGGGDVKLFGLVGLILGWPGILVAGLAAFWTGALVSGLLLLLGRKHLADQIPFAPFLVFGAALALMAGERIIQAYLGLFQ